MDFVEYWIHGVFFSVYNKFENKSIRPNRDWLSKREHYRFQLSTNLKKSFMDLACAFQTLKTCAFNKTKEDSLYVLYARLLMYTYLASTQKRMCCCSRNRNNTFPIAVSNNLKSFPNEFQIVTLKTTTWPIQADCCQYFHICLFIVCSCVCFKRLYCFRFREYLDLIWEQFERIWNGILGFSLFVMKYEIWTIGKIRKKNIRFSRAFAFAFNIPKAKQKTFLVRHIHFPMFLHFHTTWSIYI